ncbi:GNAT family N-acetyltransferase [Myroides odoratimimus]|uniref:GNAT family N-acetyltransferase n=1 Tax=Myroides odoratimimus TaxID=76832 RepID=UPI003101552A
MNIQIIQSLTVTTDIQQLITEYDRTIKVDLKPLDNSSNISTNSSTDNVSNEALLYIAKVNDTLAGCIAMHRLTDTTCEITNLYIRPQYQGLGIGIKLCQYIIQHIQSLDFKRIYVTTTKAQQGQNAIYSEYGFTKCTPYVTVPHPNAIYMDYIFVKDDYIQNNLLKAALRFFRYHRREQYR